MIISMATTPMCGIFNYDWFNCYHAGVVSLFILSYMATRPRCCISTHNLVYGLHANVLYGDAYHWYYDNPIIYSTNTLYTYLQEWHYGYHAKVLRDGPGEQRDDNKNIEK